ncbi:alkaline shock response membrane anchor protein AmaP [Paenibacillus psychroresistens]|uniref:Alkaline shock response membrane anchor protein AmaP n=1 Tax=Paenibacillus psychroresistens TaxID=1778678 RepID=A0A6B8RMW0_9BACL|nr:alkaline shock response membrane anchor protein AmaP [Paenibacillus psychroresistens]QGQ97104.1 alkaline shock response membrane anchor protein AmaP [Paenibacillus psychroresistens]
MAKIIDRLLLFILSLTIIGSACLLLLAAFGVVPYDSTIKFVRDVYYESKTAVWFITASMIILLIGIRMFYIAVRPSSVNSPSIDQRTDFGDIRISVDTVENLALKAAQRSRGVKDLKARVSISPSGLEIIIRTLVDGESSIPNLTEEIQQTVKTQIEEVTGIPVASVSVFVANIIQASPAFKSRVE